MRFHVLGTVEVDAGGRPLATGPPKQATVLAALLVDVNQPLSPQILVDRVWGEQAYDRAARTLHTYVARIRRLLADAGTGDTGAVARLLRRGNGYLIATDPDTVDLHRFRRLVAEAGRFGLRDAERVALYREALALWRGEPLTGIPGAWAARVRAQWQQLRIEAVVAWAEAEVRTGHAGTVIPPLSELVDEHPFAEALAAALMRALHAAGRSADALAQYAVTRRRLVDELAIEPGPLLREVHQAILRGDSIAPPRPRTRIPAQLPLDVHGFTGRDAELARLDAIRASAEHERTAVLVAVVSGTAGVGKTALAVHWAHRVRSGFPDGQLYVNLRGFDPAGSTVSPAEALRGFLQALDVPPAQLPLTVEARAAAYRSLVADRRLLVVLDNARSADQVRPLLPGAPGCLVLVTSRDTLPGLVAAEGAHPVSLDLLSTRDARTLLVRRLDAERVAKQPSAVDAIVARCARLPLALAIAAARAATNPTMPLDALAAELRDARGTLDAFAGSDEATDVRAVLSWSYRTLPPDAARLFRLLALPPGADVAIAAAASLAGEPVDRTRGLIDTLTRAHLLAEDPDGRYAFHDLLHAYAAERLRAGDDQDDSNDALDRVLDHYLHSAYRAHRLLDPQREPITLPPPLPGVTVETVDDHVAAMAWLTAQRETLVAAVQLAADQCLDLVAWRLAWTLATYLDRQGYWQDWAATQELALFAATRLDDRAAQGFAHRNVGLALAQLGRYDESDARLSTALRVYRELDDHAGQAHTHNSLARVRGKQQRYREALDETRNAVDLFAAAGLLAGQARALNNVGWYHALLGEHREALDRCEQALVLHRQIQDTYGEANTWDSLGFAHHNLAHYGEAVTSYRTAIDLWQEVGDRYNKADTLTRLGETYAAMGDTAEARQAWQRALAILDELGHPDAETLREKLL